MYRILFLLIISINLLGQENVTVLKTNQQIQHTKKSNNNLRSSIQLPFFDDFSYDSHFTNPLLWQNSDVFINRTLPINPITIGVATFDGLDSLGFPYDISSANSWGLADELTSNIIDLSSVDTAYFLFYVQAEGLGDQPQLEDSLVLEFLDDSLVWKRVWSINGTTTSDFEKKVILIKNNYFLHSNFQFRFKNYATLSGNYDHWHLDYVKIDKFLSLNDTNSINDVSFVYNNPSFLKRYQEMPWTHYKNNVADELLDTIDILIRNNSSSINVDYKFSVFENSNLVNIFPVGGGWRNYSVLDYDSIGNFSHDPPIYLNNNMFSSINLDSASFLVKHIIKTADNNKKNDTLVHFQNFYSHFAYDDGSAEFAYGINSVGGMTAMKFKLNRPDTLRAVQMYFPQMLDSVNLINFDLTIWDDNNGKPGNILHTQNVYPRHSSRDNFISYNLDSLFQIIGTFYVGWIQKTTDLLNIGLDKNNISNDNMYYNVGAGWNNSQFSGSWMIRPVLSSKSILLKSDFKKNDFIVFPNPTYDFSKIYFNDYRKREIFVYSYHGKLINKFTTYSKEIRINRIKKGIFLVKIFSENKVLNTKIIFN